ncbi:MAG: ferredoxin [Bacteroidales bacterium]|nr:ferredoxin [Bacteroidales bacterium]MCF8388244.1 ferredoxin [Bacteroidales bacterium]MCF8398992.1 ferredoxin [Bacteroidales bacterium]
MKFIVDEDLCIGCAACEEACPDVFQMSDDGEMAKVILDPVPEDLQDCAMTAEEECPVEAISHE